MEKSVTLEKLALYFYKGFTIKNLNEKLMSFINQGIVMIDCADSYYDDKNDKCLAVEIVFNYLLIDVNKILKEVVSFVSYHSITLRFKCTYELYEIEKIIDNAYKNSEVRLHYYKNGSSRNEYVDVVLHINPKFVSTRILTMLFNKMLYGKRVEIKISKKQLERIDWHTELALLTKNYGNLVECISIRDGTLTLMYKDLNKEEFLTFLNIRYPNSLITYQA